MKRINHKGSDRSFMYKFGSKFKGYYVRYYNHVNFLSNLLRIIVRGHCII